MSAKNNVKWCSSCKQNKPVSVFQKNRASKDGLQAYCKLCRNNAKREYRKTDKSKEYHRNYMKNRRKTGKCKIYEKEYRKSTKGKEAQKKHYAENTHKYKARRSVSYAIETGKLVRPGVYKCECGKQAQEYHHPDYKPENSLNVIALCRVCHKKLHR